MTTTTNHGTNKYDRYLRLVKWAANRYTSNGTLNLTVGGLRTTPYSRIEAAAAKRLLATA